MVRPSNIYIALAVVICRRWVLLSPLFFDHPIPQHSLIVLVVFGLLFEYGLYQLHLLLILERTGSNQALGHWREQVWALDFIISQNIAIFQNG